MNIIPYNTKHKDAFKHLNIEWLETYFYVEPYDLEVLSKPETYIINKGGYIFFAQHNDEIVGTVALMPTAVNGVLELTKMAVSPQARGLGIGQKLMEHCIAFAKAENLSKLILYSNTILENAIHIYKKWGFIEIPVEENASYERANIKMEKIINHK
ncbi:GNAT family N-acetyltransferase [Dokdonia genika]|uniref:GNAT family N-acetyltransferase n=1 Tax=Dokdonia genika TaxID=308113 RepID=A0ABV9LBU1_9FLAO|nr:transcriptional regulator, MarR family [uncultured bacterium]